MRLLVAWAVVAIGETGGAETAGLAGSNVVRAWGG